MYKLLHIPTGTYLYAANLYKQQDNSCLLSREEVEAIKAKVPNNIRYEVAIFSSLNEIYIVLNDMPKNMFPIYFNVVDSEILHYEPIKF